MPVMDGLTMAYEIRGISPSVPIIVLTAFEQTDYLKRAVDIGIDKYVMKPVNSFLLFKSMLDCVHRLRAEELLKREQQRQAESIRLKHHEIIADLARGMAHDYNNLLQAIMGSVYLAKLELAADSKSYGYLQSAEERFAQAGDHGLLLELLDTNGSLRANVGALMQSIRSTLEDALIGASIVLNTDYPDDLPEIRFIESQMQMAFESLAANAIEAMPVGGSLYLSAEEIAISEHDILPLLPGNYLHISLTDTGCGIAPEIITKIYDPYFSTKEKSTERVMGLSLALCHTIILKHGGIITAESNPGVGATFHIWLPTAA